jgi:hypothetical protein
MMNLGRRAAIAAVLLVTAFLGTPPSTAQAADASPPSWTGPHHLGGGLRSGFVTSVSCGSTASCWAVDGEGNGLHLTKGHWTPGRSIDRHFGALASVSCPTARFCLALGGARSVYRNGHGWSRVAVTHGANLYSVSCTSAHFCLAVGVGVWARWNGRRWVDVHHPTAPISHHSLPADLVSVSCVDPRFCLVLNGHGAVQRYDGHRLRRSVRVVPGQGWLYSRDGDIDCLSRTFCLAASDQRAGASQWAAFDGHRWRHDSLGTMDPPSSVSCSDRRHCAVTFDSTALSWQRGRISARDLGSSLADVSCPASGHCVAVGEGPRSWRYNGTRWHPLTQPLAPVPGPSSFGISCTSPRWCLAVNGAHDWSYDGSTWLRGPDLPAFTEPVTGRQAVSCSAPNACMALANTGELSAYDGSSWSTPFHAPGGWEDVACGAPTFCIAVGHTSTDPGEGSSAVMTWDGTSWSAPQTGGSVLFTTASCPSAALCFIGDDDGGIRTFDGTTMSDVVFSSRGDDGDNALNSLSCASATTCVARGIGENYVVQRDGRWHEAFGPASLTESGDSSCGAEDACLLIGDGTFAAPLMANGIGKVERVAPLGYEPRTPRVSCAGPRFCAALDRGCNIFVRR